MLFKSLTDCERDKEMKIKFLPTGQEIENDPNKTLLQLCTENHIEIRSICKGVPSCAECRVKIVDGEHNVLPPTKAEIGVVGSNYFIDQRRLACQVHCFGQVTVDITEQIERSETQNKKVRGFRAANQKGVIETHAKQGTMVLEEPVEVKPEHKPQQHRPQQRDPQKNQPRPQQRQQSRPQHQEDQGGENGGGQHSNQNNKGGNRHSQNAHQRQDRQNNQGSNQLGRAQGGGSGQGQRNNQGGNRNQQNHNPRNNNQNNNRNNNRGGGSETGNY